MIAHIMLWDELTKLWPVQVVTNATTHNPSVFFALSELNKVTIWAIVKYISNSAMASTTTGG